MSVNLSENYLKLCYTGVGFEPTISAGEPVPVAARSKAQVYGRSPAAIVGSNPTQGLDVCVL